MGKAIAFMTGVLLFGHGLLGLFVEGQHLLIFNVDITLDIVYLLSGALLLFVGGVRVSGGLVRYSMLFIAALMALLGAIGIVDDRLGGAAPTGLTAMDIVLYFGVTLALLFGAVQKHIEQPIEEQQPGAPVEP